MIKTEMYCRTEQGIGKIEKIEKYKNEFIITLDCGILIDDTGFTEEEMIRRYKISNSIIDIIEEGDYVNGYKVDKKYEDRVVIDINNEIIVMFDYRIKSIVTKEQFKNMEYKL